MAVFEYNFSKLSNSMQVDLKNTFKTSDLPKFMDFFRHKVASGNANWEISLKDLQFINSEFIGMLILMNMLLATQKGTLRLIVSKDSTIQDLFSQSKLERIIHVRTT